MKAQELLTTLNTTTQNNGMETVIQAVQYLGKDNVDNLQHIQEFLKPFNLLIQFENHTLEIHRTFSTYDTFYHDVLEGQWLVVDEKEILVMSNKMFLQLTRINNYEKIILEDLKIPALKDEGF